MPESVEEIEQEIAKLEGEFESKKTAKAQDEGKLAVAKESLEKFGASSVEEADGIISELDEELTEIDGTISTKFIALKEEYVW